MSGEFRGDPENPFEALDIFGEREPDRITVMGIAYSGTWDAAVLYGHFAGTVRRTLDEYNPQWSLLARSARQSLVVQLRALREEHEAIEAEWARAKQSRSEAEQARAANCIAEHLRAMEEAWHHAIPAIDAIRNDDPIPRHGPDPIPDLPPLVTADAAAAAEKNALDAALAEDIGAGKPRLLVLKATPGVGKTENMVAAALAAQRAGKKVLFLAKTKGMIQGDHAELLRRLDPGRHRTALTIVGRDEFEDPLWGLGIKSCFQLASVELAIAQGLAPGRAVCTACVHYPDNAWRAPDPRYAGTAPVCGYYRSRIFAHTRNRQALEARRHNPESTFSFPILVSTHATGVAIAQPGGGGRFQAIFTGIELLFIDEDPTDAMRVDTLLSEEQCLFTAGGNAERLPAEYMAKLLRIGIEIAARERSAARDDQFRALGQKQVNSHPAHQSHGSCYRGEQLHALLEQVARGLGNVLGKLVALVAGPGGQEGFAVASGALAGVTDMAGVHAQHIPPTSLLTVATALQDEMHLHLRVRQAVHRRLQRGEGEPSAIGLDLTAPSHASEDLDQRIAPDVAFAYQVRLECLPQDLAKGRKKDVWQYVVREQRPMFQGNATTIIGDAYATRDHYERLFPNHDVRVLEHVAQLHPGSTITRVVDRHCSITQLERGELQRVLGLVESHMLDHYQTGQRVLIYGHRQLKKRAEAFLRGIGERLGIPDTHWAYEHWWGGRGKDRYFGWEWLYTISDPVVNLSSLEHEVNAQRFRAAEHAQRTGAREELLHLAERVQVGAVTHGTTAAIEKSHPWIQTEAFRQNTAELVQAMHRGRPARAPVNVITLGTVVSTPDLLAQTCTVAEEELARVGGSAPSATEDGQVAMRVTPTIAHMSQGEVLAAVQGIVEWFGVFSSTFAHALLTSTKCHTALPDGQKRSYGEDLISRSRILEVTPIERVWDPPLHWWLLKSRDTLPHVVRQVLAQLDHLYASFVPVDLPSWMGRQQGRSSRVYYDPELCAEAEARRLYGEILVQQYGPMSDARVPDPEASEGFRVVRQLHRPRFDPRLPPCLKAFRANAPF